MPILQKGDPRLQKGRELYQSHTEDNPNVSGSLCLLTFMGVGGLSWPADSQGPVGILCPLELSVVLGDQGAGELEDSP